MDLHPEQRQRDFEFITLGDFLGEGASRQTYRSALNPDLVIKVAKPGSFARQNVIEWEAWGFAEGTDMERWLAPCYRISATGMFLVMHYVPSLPRDYALPKTLPGFLNDLQPTNFGLLKGRLVARDYGIIIESLTRFKAKRKAIWDREPYIGRYPHAGDNL